MLFADFFSHVFLANANETIYGACGGWDHGRCNTHPMAPMKVKRNHFHLSTNLYPSVVMANVQFPHIISRVMQCMC